MWGDSAGSEDPRELTRSPGGVAQLGSAHGGSVRDRQVGEERMGHHVWAGQQAGWQGQRDWIAPHLPSQQHRLRQDRQHGLPTTAWEGSTKGGGEGLQGLYSSHNKQA